MTPEEKHRAIDVLGDKLDAVMEGAELSVCMIAFIEVVGAQIMGCAMDHGHGRDWYIECADKVRADLISFWEMVYGSQEGRTIN